MSESDAIVLEHLYHITRDLYAVKDVTDTDTFPEPPKFDYEELYRTIYAAVYEGVKEAFK